MPYLVTRATVNFTSCVPFLHSLWSKQLQLWVNIKKSKRKHVIGNIIREQLWRLTQLSKYFSTWISSWYFSFTIIIYPWIEVFNWFAHHKTTRQQAYWNKTAKGGRCCCYLFNIVIITLTTLPSNRVEKLQIKLKKAYK